MLPTYASSASSKLSARYHGGSFANGYPRDKEKMLDLSPHRYGCSGCRQPPTYVFRRLTFVRPTDTNLEHRIQRRAEEIDCYSD
jgi:hypothetical protein